MCCEDVQMSPGCRSLISRLHLFQLLTQSLTDVAACPWTWGQRVFHSKYGVGYDVMMSVYVCVRTHQCQLVRLVGTLMPDCVGSAA